MSMIHEITSLVPRQKERKRLGRGEASGQGKTAGHGTKGSGQRQGKSSFGLGHEGGQTRIYRRLPTRGFSNFDFAKRWYVVNVRDLNDFADGATVDVVALKEKGLVPDAKLSVKVLGEGDLTRKLTVIAGWYSKSAFEKITAAGGAAQNLKGETFEFPKPKKKFIPREPVKKPKADAKGEAEGAAPAEAKPKKTKEKPAEKPAEQAAEKPTEEKQG